MNKIICLTIFLTFTYSISHLFGQAGTLDSSFGTNGVTLTNIVDRAEAYSAARQPDGKIVAVGRVYLSNLFYYGWGVARYSIDGTLDSTFANDGVTINFTTEDAGATSVAIGPDGKIAVTGYVADFYGFFAIAMFNPDGSPDTTFGNYGFLTIDTIQLYSVAIQSDGKIVVAGSSAGGNNFFNILVRYNIDGTRDSSFNDDGIATTSMGGIGCGISSIVIQPDGKIITGGCLLNSLTDRDFALARYNTDGSLDSSFGGDGITTSTFEGDNDVIGSMVLQPDEKIVVAGTSYNGIRNIFSLARYNNDGTVDIGFNNGALLYTTFGVSTDDIVESIALQSDGKIVAAGYSSNGVESDFAIARYTSYGTLDSSFATFGKLTSSFSSASEEAASSVIIQSSGKIVIVGYSGEYFALARYFSTPGVGGIDLASFADLVSIYPNPIEEKGVLRYTLSKEEIISIRLFDLQGKLVTTFIDNVYQEPGEHTQTIALPRNLSSGSYYIVISPVGAQEVSIKVMR